MSRGYGNLLVGCTPYEVAMNHKLFDHSKDLVTPYEVAHVSNLAYTDLRGQIYYLRWLATRNFPLALLFRWQSRLISFLELLKAFSSRTVLRLLSPIDIQISDTRRFLRRWAVPLWDSLRR